MKTTLYIISAALMLAGLVFFLQGLNILPGSFMTGQIFWAAVGFFLLIVGAGMAFFTYQRGHRP